MAFCYHPGVTISNQEGSKW